MAARTTEDVQGSETILYYIVIVDGCRYTIVKTHTTYTTNSEPLCNLWTWVIMMSQCRFINCNKYTTLVGNVNSVRGCSCVGTG